LRREAVHPDRRDDEPGALSEPFRSRFKTQERLELYEVPDLARIVEGRARGLGLSISAEAAQAIGCRARGVPREAVRLLERVRDVAQLAARTAIELGDVLEAARRSGIDENGLWIDDRGSLSS